MTLHSFSRTNATSDTALPFAVIGKINCNNEGLNVDGKQLFRPGIANNIIFTAQTAEEMYITSYSFDLREICSIT